MPGDTIRASPYEPGLYFVGGTVGTNQWQVGTRYSLERVLGHGGFSSVCLALDHQTGEKVALKRIPDVLSSPENAKRVLREVCILRRLAHPNIIAIKDCFVRPSATGQCRLVKGKLVNLSIDVYIAMEYGDGGDLFHLKGQLSAEEVKSIMWQLTHCLKYLHDLHVWHRDLKSQNVFVTWEAGELVVKLGDFGSARSAIPEGYPSAEQRPPSKSNAVTTLQPKLHSVDSYAEMHRSTHPHDIYVRIEEGGAGKRPGFKAPLTRVVATPCYRAPEVVMSRGGYTASIDMWSLGCILGELLQRIAHVGSAATPNLQVAPLFAITDMPRTPENGEKFGVGPGHETTRRELEALFSVIGTPAWADVAAVEHPAWRSYLHRLPGKAPTLYRRFAAAGEVPMDLLSRLLAFDPARRCSAEEALAHEYFWDVLTASDSGPMEEVPGGAMHRNRSSRGMLLLNGEQGGEQAQQAQQRGLPRVGSDHGSETSMASGSGRSVDALAGAQIPRRRSGAALGAAAPAGVGTTAAAAAAALPPLPPRHHHTASHPHAPRPAAAVEHSGSGEHVQQAQQAQQPEAGDVAMPDASPFEQPADAGQQQSQQAAASGAGAAAAAAGGAGAAAEPRSSSEGEEERIWHYWEETDPARALGMLENELATITSAEPESCAPGGEGSLKLRRLLELECEAIAASRGGTWLGRKRRAVRLPLHDQGVLSGLLAKAGPGLQLDAAATEGQFEADYGQERLSNVADTWQGQELDPEKYLGPQRHGEWTAFTGAGPPPGPRWGVSAMPPGVDESSLDPRMAAVIKAQQLR